MPFYLGTIVVSFIGNMIVCLKVSKDMYNKGYKFKEKKKNIFDVIIGFTKWIIYSAIPIGNLILSGILIFSADKLSKSFIADGVKTGAIIRKEEQRVIEEIEVDNNLVEDAKVIVYKVENKEKKELSVEEKIEFLKQECARLKGEELKTEEKTPKQYGLLK